MFSDERTQAIELFEEFSNQHSNDQCLDYDERVRVSDSEVRILLAQHSIKSISQLQQLEKQRKNEILKAIKSIDGVTIRQLSRITGISKSVIDRV